jgi:cyclic beta-1,2-glucan synthetase
VYAQPPHVGRGGWSWYTGAASWLHRTAVESIFGLRMGARTIALLPSLPAHWPRAEITLRRGERSEEVLVIQGDAPGPVPGDARPLQRGESVTWADLPLASRFVLRLPARELNAAR